MKKIDFKELSADQQECLHYALGDFLNNYNFRERADDLLRDIENMIIHGQNVGQMQNLSKYVVPTRLQMCFGIEATPIVKS